MFLAIGRSAFRAETVAPDYAVSKAGMVNLTRCLARAEAKNGILSYCIAPGFVETAMARDSVRELGMEALTADIPSSVSPPSRTWPASPSSSPPTPPTTSRASRYL